MNKYKLINLKTNEEHLCEKVEIDGFEYYLSNEEIMNGDWSYDIMMKSINQINNVYSKKVIATNNSNIDLPKVVDEVEKLANIYCKEMDRIGEFHDFHSFKYAYNKSQESCPFSEEDMIEFAEWCQNQYFYSTVEKKWSTEFKIYDGVLYTTKELIELWKQQKTKIVYYE